MGYFTIHLHNIKNISCGKSVRYFRSSLSSCHKEILLLYTRYTVYSSEPSAIFESIFLAFFGGDFLVFLVIYMVIVALWNLIPVNIYDSDGDDFHLLM